ncbi:DUF4097 family beta strand repeat-containing protein [Cohnella thailandensis]|uniref:DUF4097 family beta strand repeat-containing protein n=1 Tax=Cohnella thailandensis TaxID=557557 RepID=UPI001C886874|nr:DUF4097 family beta strand repeat-containing protein [Cohnella thailandensis]MBP1972061.1 hypothetical protein [Cohnella thailandensis]
MNKKRWISIALGLILIGIGGAAFYNFQFGEDKQSYEHIMKLGSKDLKQLAVQSDSLGLRVSFVPSEDGTNSVRIAGRAKEEIIDQVRNARLSGGVLKINMKEGWSFASFDFDFNSVQEITVSLTEEAAAALQSFKVDTDSGSVRVNGAAAAKGEIESDSGSIKLYGFQGETLELESDSGSIHAENLTAALTASSESGSITIDHLKGVSKLESDSGSIRLLKDDASDADIKSDSGSVRVEVPNDFGGFYDLKSDSGSVRSPDSEKRTTETIKVRTDSGSIRVTQP